MAWHLKGAPDLDQWLRYSQRRRLIIIRETKRRVEIYNSQFPEE